MNMIKNCTSCSLANYLTTFMKSSTHTRLSRELQSVMYKTDSLLMLGAENHHCCPQYWEERIIQNIENLIFAKV